MRLIRFGARPRPEQIRRADALRRSGLFDEVFYRLRYPDVREAGVDAVLHYVCHGAREGRRASPLFDVAWYLRQHPEVADSPLDPLTHYLEIGAAAGFDPHPLFDGAGYARQEPDTARHGLTPLGHYLLEGEARDRRPNPLFRPSWYRDHCPEAGAQPLPLLAHYFASGEADGHLPHPLFDPGWYRARHPEAGASGLGALGHYLREGWRAGFDPHPLFQVGWYRRQAAVPADREPVSHYEETGEAAGLRPNPLFDPGFYRERNPDLLGSPGLLLVHYAMRGWKEGRAPHPLFDPAWYRARHPHVAASDIEPLGHWLRVGGAAGLDPHPLFDASGYRAAHPEVEGSGLDPLSHYLEVGALAGFDPNPLFDGDWYARAHPEAGERGLAPLAHYVLEGEARGLRPHPLFDPAFYRAQYPDLQSWPETALAHFLAFGAREGRRPHPLFDAPGYRAQHPEAAASGLDPLTHWLRVGAAAGFDPHPLFDVGWYRGQAPEAAATDLDPLSHYLEVGAARGVDPHPLFDGADYARRVPGLAARGLTPLEHYVLEGEARGERPNPLFDPGFYREQYPDLRSYPLPLLAHYAAHGWKEGRRPHPLFDPAWYVTQPGVSEEARAAGAPVEPLAHWLRVGRAAGLDPHPLFDTDWYRARHPEVEARRLDPLAHWEAVGARAGFDPHPLFDTAWYRAYHASALDPDADPLRHYVEEGALHGWLPNPFFDPAWYLARYGVRLRPRETPLAHFAREGAPRGRRPGPLFDFCVRFFRDRDAAREAEGPLAGWFHPDYRRLSSPGVELPVPLPEAASPQVSIVVPAFGPPAWTLACLRAIAHAETRASYEVIVVDDDPGRGIADALAGIPRLRVVRQETNQGFVAACNRGAREARGEELVLLNNDALPMDGWLDELLATRERFPDAGIVGAKLLFPNGLLQEAGGVVRSDGSARNVGLGGDPEAPAYDFARPVDYASGAALCVRRALFLELGGLDDAYRPAFYEDTDLAFRVREKGLSVVYQPGARVVHFGGATCGRDPRTGTKRHQVLHRETFSGRWAARLAEQPPPEASAEDAALARFRRHAFVMDATLLTPDQDSGSLRMFHVLRLLRSFGYHVTFVPFDGSRRDRYVAQLRRWGIDVVVPPHLRSIEELLEERGWRQDLCLLSRPDVAERWLEPVRLLCPSATVLYDTVDLHFLRRAREVAVRGTSNLPESQREQELRAARRADAVVVVSEVDRHLLLAEDPALRVHVLSNVHEVRPTRTPFAEREGILFIGGFRHAPNADAVLWFVRDVLPLVHRELPELRFHVIGSEIPPEVRALGSERVVIEGYVPDVMPFFERCRLSVAPLRYGAGVKGKINQSMSHGVPCVATSVATEGMELAPGEDVLVADDAERFAARVVELYRDEALWTRLAANALRNVERVFSVDVARARLQAILREHGLG